MEYRRLLDFHLAARHFESWPSTIAPLCPEKRMRTTWPILAVAIGGALLAAQAPADPPRAGEIPKPVDRNAYRVAKPEAPANPAPPPPIAESAEVPESGIDPAAIARWKLETVTLKSGQQVRGFVQRKGPQELEVVVVAQPAGRPMHLVIRPIPTSAVAKIENLPDAERKELARKIGEFRARLPIEAGRMERIAVVRDNEGATGAYVVVGPWFTLRSTADEETTRRVAVRLDQIFCAFRQIFPPKRSPSSPLEIQLYGTLRELREVQQGQTIPPHGTAWFSVTHNRIVSGSDLMSLGEYLAQAETRHDEIQKQCKSLQLQLPQLLAKLAAEMRDMGIGEQIVEQELSLRRAAAEAECRSKLAEIAAATRRNEAQFASHTAQLFTRLYHEAFHAYFENYVYPRRESHVPRWLHEGLAQVFESGQLEGEMLRVDAPGKDLLLELQRDLAGGAPLKLADLLSAEDGMFLVSHAGKHVSRRHYLYAWGLAWWLTYRERTLGSEALDRYVARAAEGTSPLLRFEQLVGRKTDAFEREWQLGMLALKPAR